MDLHIEHLVHDIFADNMDQITRANFRTYVARYYPGIPLVSDNAFTDVSEAIAWAMNIGMVSLWKLKEADITAIMEEYYNPEGIVPKIGAKIGPHDVGRPVAASHTVLAILLAVVQVLREMDEQVNNAQGRSPVH